MGSSSSTSASSSSDKERLYVDPDKKQNRHEEQNRGFKYQKLDDAESKKKENYWGATWDLSSKGKK